MANERGLTQVVSRIVPGYPSAAPLRHRRSFAWPHARGLLVLAALACSKSDTTAPTITRVDVNPTTLTLTGIGATGSMSATVLGPLGAPITNPTVTWSSDNASVVSVVGGGLVATVTAVAAGSATIRAASGGMNGTAVVTVDAKVRSVRITPIPFTVRASETGTLTAIVDADVGVSQAVTWSSNATTIATVSAAGVVTGVQQGNATITATSVADPSKSASLVATVTPAAVATVTVTIANATLNVGQTSQATVRTFDLLNRELTGRAVTWSSSSPNEASVSASGLVTALSRGAAPVQITATSEGKSGSVAVTVRGVISVTVSPPTLTTPIGSLLQLTATVEVDPGTGFSSAVTWTSRNPAIVTVNTTGLISALASGQTFIVATSQADASKRDSSLVIVPNPCAAPIALTLGTAVTGQITAGDCGGIFDLYQYTIPTQTFYAVQFQPASNQNLAPLFPDVPVQWILGGGSNFITFALAAAGTHQIQVAARDVNSRGSYTLTTILNPAATCPLVFASLGVSRTFLLSGCPLYTPAGLTGAFTAQQYFVNVPANKQLRVTVQSAAFQARAELKAFAGTTAIASAFAPAVGGSAVLTFTPTIQSVFNLFITSQTVSSVGNYTITIDP